MHSAWRVDALLFFCGVMYLFDLFFRCIGSALLILRLGPLHYYRVGIVLRIRDQRSLSKLSIWSYFVIHKRTGFWLVDKPVNVELAPSFEQMCKPQPKWELWMCTDDIRMKKLLEACRSEVAVQEEQQ